MIIAMSSPAKQPVVISPLKMLPVPVVAGLNEDQLFRMSRRNFELYRNGVLNNGVGGGARRLTGSITKGKGLAKSHNNHGQGFSKILQKMLVKPQDTSEAKR